MEVSVVAVGKNNASVQDLTGDDITVKDNNKKQPLQQTKQLRGRQLQIQVKNRG